MAYGQGSATLSWTPPTQNTDGSELTDLAGYDVHWGTAPGDYQQSVTLESPGLAGYVFENLTAGDWYFAVRTFNAAGTRSELSNEASKTIADASEPDPPENLVVNPDELTAYGIVQSRDRLVLLPVGQVTAGVACDGGQAANGRYVVPRDTVDFAGSVEPQVVFADCVPEVP